jgi:hypothetical protein
MSTPSTSTTSTTAKVPRLLWESFESILLAEGKRFVRDIANTLQVSEKELVKRVFPTNDALHIHLHDTHTETLDCMAFLAGGPVARRCRRPVQLGSEFCTTHLTHRPLYLPSAPIRKLQDHPERPSLWVQADGTVIDEHGAPHGTYSEETGKLLLFQQ